MGSATPRPASDFFICVWGGGCLRPPRPENVDQYSDHGQSVTSSSEYCQGKNVSTISNSDQHGIAANVLNATTPGRRLNWRTAISN